MTSEGAGARLVLVKRGLSLLAVSAWLLQGLFVLPLHEMQEAAEHPDCGACIVEAPQGPSAGPLHSHPIHDGNQGARGEERKETEEKETEEGKEGGGDEGRNRGEEEQGRGGRKDGRREEG